MIKKFFRSILIFLKKWGLFGVAGYVTLFIPLGIGYLLSNDNLITTGLVVAAIVATPNGVGLLMTVIFAALYKWMWTVLILGFIAWAKETITKVQTQSQMMLYYDSEEIQMILDHGKEIKKYTDKQRSIFNSDLKRIRLEMIDKQWTKEVKENDKKNKTREV